MATFHSKLVHTLGIDQGGKNKHEWIGIDSTQQKHIKISYHLSSHTAIKRFIAVLKKANLPYNGNGCLITVLYPCEAFLDDTHCVALIEKIKRLQIYYKAKETEEKNLPNLLIRPCNIKKSRVITKICCAKRNWSYAKKSQHWRGRRVTKNIRLRVQDKTHKLMI